MAMVANKGHRGGFTLIEVLVASLLLGMLVTILTMVFNQSSIAWRTGKASVVEMDGMRRLLAQTQRRGDEILPGVREEASPSKWGCVVGAWDNTRWNGQRNSLNKRAVEDFDDNRVRLGSQYLDRGRVNPYHYNQAWQVPNKNFNDSKMGKLKAFVVGVWSYGPDGKPDTADDISSWPNDME